MILLSRRIDSDYPHPFVILDDFVALEPSKDMLKSLEHILHLWLMEMDNSWCMEWAMTDAHAEEKKLLYKMEDLGEHTMVWRYDKQVRARGAGVQLKLEGT